MTTSRSSKTPRKGDWAQLCCFAWTCLQLWKNVVVRKWFNIRPEDTEFSADEEESTESEVEDEEACIWDKQLNEEERRMLGFTAESSGNKSDRKKICKRQRHLSETFRAQYISTEELRFCVKTWNVGGKLPTNDLVIKEWLDLEEPADVYVFGFQEVVPLNAANIFGAEDNRSVEKWNGLISEALNHVKSVEGKYKSYSDPSSSRFNPSDGDDLFRDTSSQFLCSDSLQQELFLPHKSSQISDDSFRKTHRSSERIGLLWPEKQLDLLAQNTSDIIEPRKAVDSLKSHSLLKSRDADDEFLGTCISKLNLDGIKHSKEKSSFVRIICKQMVGIFLSIWVRQCLRKHIQNLKISTVGVGAMNYMGNKGSISVSMSIHETLFCFICCHLSSGEKDGDELRRNADVHKILRRTRFKSSLNDALPRTILEHEKIIWLGDLNYRINLPYERTHELITKKEWSSLVMWDQLKQQLNEGRAFDGWSEGPLNFPPTYKYESNSDEYVGDDLKAQRRNPAWCDRILAFGKGMKLLCYERNELKLSDHRPVTAIYAVEVEVFCPRKLERALFN